MDDKSIVNAILNDGQSKLFSLVVKRYGGIVFSKALGITKNEEHAKDISQQTFLKAYSQLDSWHGRELGPWLIAIACHLSLNLLERERRRAEQPLDGIQAPDVTYSEEHEENLQKMEVAISHLPERDRLIIRLFYYEHVKTDDIAKKIGMSASNVLVRLHRIREQLKKELQP